MEPRENSSQPPNDTTNHPESLTRSISYDPHGFIINNDQAEENLTSPRQADSDSHLSDNWIAVCDRWNHVQDKSPLKVRHLLRRGMPNEMRPKIWKMFLNSDAPKQQQQGSFNYQNNVFSIMSLLEDHGIKGEDSYTNLKGLNRSISLSEEVHCEASLIHLRQILMDIDRTFPDHKLFTSGGPGRSSLLKVLAVYSQYNPTVGYCQGMSYVAAMLLMYLDEEDAFWALVSLFEGPKYLANFYDKKFTKLQAFAEVFSYLLKDRQCQLASHLDELGLHPLMYTVQWFLCLFTFLPCWDTVLLICDLLFLEGVTALLRAGLALMEQLSNELKAISSLGEAIHFIQNPPKRLVSRSQMVQALWHTRVDKQQMDAYMDVAVIHKDTEETAPRITRSSRKRPREDDTNNCKDKSSQGSIFSRLMETPAKKLRELASASVVKSSSLLRSRKIASRTPSRTKMFNIPRIKGPVTKYPEENLAFRTFNTPAPLKSHQVQDAGIPSCSKDGNVSPEVEMKDMNANSNQSPLQRTLFPDE
ncbi:TBC1 domain family member whacked-like isoform X2 [Dysidea avara]|uniref:TBC1 domain family member whacked-like isoform X2 n=1 Tax=Dysidea avara TaxID=196820 RepID=UPI00332DD58B